MDAKISITTKCNAKCKTCPVWKYPGKDMSFENLKTIYDKLNDSLRIDKIFLNNTGDLYNHPEHIDILKYIELYKKKNVFMTTNGALMDYVPAIDMIIISFNGGDKESFEFTTGLDFEKTKQNIESHYAELKKIPFLEMHCLIWKGNEGTEHKIAETMKDFPGCIRISYKYDNQQAEDQTVEKFKRTQRYPCDYLDKLNIMPNGDVILCAHDFKSENVIGNILNQSIDELISDERRITKQREHDNFKYLGICEKCNYNTDCKGRVGYIKARSA